jgi:N-acetylglucosamine kinase-like BadF-type ATPase
VARLSRLVDDAAVAGDPVAHQILETAAQQLVTITEAVRKRLFDPRERVLVAHAGGVFRCNILGIEFARLLSAHEVMSPMYEPVVGALVEAFRLAGLPTLAGKPVLPAQPPGS